MAFGGLILGELLDALQVDEATSKVTHTKRSEEAREVDNREWAETQTTDIHEWLQAPDEVDFVTVDNPAFHNGMYEPWREWEGRDDV